MSTATFGGAPSDRGLRMAVALSAVVHLVAVGLWRVADMFQPTAPPPAIMVSLEPPGKGGSQAGTPPAPKASATPAPPQPAPKPPPAPKPQAKPAPKPAPVAKPQAVPSPSAKPQPQPAPAPAAQATPDPAPAAAGLADIRKLLAERKSEQVGDGGAGDGDGYGLPSGVTGRLYFAQLEAAVRAAWAVPPGARRDPVLIEVRIGADGRLLARGMLRSSGDPLLDRSALAALDRADLPPPPPEFKTPLKLTFQLVPPDR